AAVAEMEKASEEWWATECFNYRSWVQMLKAQAYIKTGSFDRAEGLIQDAETWMAATNERWNEAEFHRVRGDLIVAERRPVACSASACFRTALEVARRQNARAFELQAATSLASLWMNEGRATDARDMLRSVLSSFAEGHTTKHYLAATRL